MRRFSSTSSPRVRTFTVWFVALCTTSSFCRATWAARKGLSIGCADDFDCSLNGICSTSSGACACDSGWSGKSCETLDVQPTEWEWGYNKLGSEQTSSWGGGGWWDSDEGRYFVWVTELSHNCGMHTWTTNSKTVRASSASFRGPYTREEEEFPVWTHEAAVTRGPNGEYVAYMSYQVPSPYPECVGTCSDGSTPPGQCQKRPPGLMISSRDPTYMSWAPRPRGPWSTPVPVLMPNPQMDTNMAVAIDSRGAMVGLWRDHKAGSRDIKHSVVHLVTASNWSDPGTYRWDQEDLFFGQNSETAKRKKTFLEGIADGGSQGRRDLQSAGDKDSTWEAGFEDVSRKRKKHGGNPGGVEDMFIWTDKRGHYHAVTHQMFGCVHCVGHAASIDGSRWLYTGPAAYHTVEFTNGTTFAFSRTERPKILFGKDGTTPVALTQGVKPLMPGYAGDDESFTLLRPIGPGSSEAHTPESNSVSL